MKPLLAFMFTVTCASGFALSALPDGHWEGQGHYRTDSGAKGDSTEALTIKANVMTSEMTIGSQKEAYVLKHEFKANDFFTVSIEQRSTGKTSAGAGYCGSLWCHVASNDNTFEMTYVFDQANVYELGHDVSTAGTGWFESALTKK